MVNKRLFSRVLALLFAIIFSACGYIENTKLTIISPAENARVSTEQIDAKLATYHTVSVNLESNRTDVSSVTARIYVNETPQGTCTLMLNLESACEIPMAVTGNQTVRFEVDKQDGTIISDQVTFLWMPYKGLDLVGLSLANVVNSNNPTDGFNLLGIALLVILVPAGLIAGRKNGVAMAIVIVWATTMGAVLVLLNVNPLYAYGIFTKILGLLGFVSFFGLVGFLASAGYMFRGSGSVDFVSRNWYPNGKIMNETRLIRKDPIQIGPGQYIRNPTATEIRAIVESLAIMIPGTMAQARYLLEQFPDRDEREEVLDLIAENGSDKYELASAIQTIQNDPKAQVVAEKGEWPFSGLFGQKNKKSHLKG